MKWIKTLEKFVKDSTSKTEPTKEESQKDLEIISSEKEVQKEKDEITDSFVDDQGVVHIEDWEKY